MRATTRRPRNRPHTRLRVYRGGLAAAVLLAPFVATAGRAATAAVDPARPVRASVCGGHVPDATYEAEAPLLGTAHACEHLEVPAADPAGAVGGHGHLAAADSDADATVSADPAIAGSWSTPFKPPTTAIGITSVLLHTG
jgi:hypothetical protein